MLRNRAGIRDQAELTEFEALSVTQRSEEPLPDGRLTLTHYKAIHRHLFQDVYNWAGRIRTVRIAKDGAPFCYPENIDAQLADLFGRLKNERHLQGLAVEAFATRAAHYLSELNAIHAFRDGNGRAQNSFLALLAAKAGHPLDFEMMDPPAFLQAMIRSFYADYGPLERQIAAMAG